MGTLNDIPRLLKEAGELLQQDTKTSKRKAASKLKLIAAIAETESLTIETNIK